MPDAGSTPLGTNSPLVTKCFSVSLAVEADNKSIFVSAMTGKKSSQAVAMAKHRRQQTSPDMPIVLIDDLQREDGEMVTCDLSRIAAGAAAPFRDTATLRIARRLFRCDVPGQIMRKRPPDELRIDARGELARRIALANDQVVLAHLAGARGSENTEVWNVPLESDREFTEIMVNNVQAPTTNRYFVAGRGTTVEHLTTSDALTLENLVAIGKKLRAMPCPPPPISLMNDPDAEQEPLWCVLVTERQWCYLCAAAGGEDWQTFTENAQQRAARAGNPPLFDGKTVLRNGLLIKRMPHAIRFQEGDKVKTTESCTGNGQCHIVPAGVRSVDRAILLGGQALAWARGDAGGWCSGCSMRWTEELYDHHNSVEIGAAQVDGKMKIRIRSRDGDHSDHTDFGVAVIDSYAPDPKCARGKSLLAALRS